MFNTGGIAAVNSVKEQLAAKAAGFSLKDALSDHTRLLKRNLMTWSALLFLCKFYNLKLSTIPYFEVTVPADRTDALVVVVFVPLVYTFISFSVHVIADLRTWHLEFNGEIANYCATVLEAANQYLGRFQNPQVISTEQGGDLLSQTQKAIKGLVEERDRMITDARAISRLRKFLAYSWESALPALFSLATVFYAREELFDAFGAVLGAG